MSKLVILRKSLLYLLPAISITILALSVYLLLASVGYMERGFIGTSLLSALIGFALLSASLYIMRLAAYVYAAEKTASG
jgi:hypothetical protein